MLVLFDPRPIAYEAIALPTELPRPVLAAPKGADDFVLQQATPTDVMLFCIRHLI